jgi:hypothetical protein
VTDKIYLCTERRTSNQVSDLSAGNQPAMELREHLHNRFAVSLILDLQG